MKALNLARQPFRNERVPTLALAGALVLLVALSVAHLVAALELRPGGSRDAERELAAMDKEIAALRSEAKELSGVSARKEATEEWAALKDLVDRRAFSWTGLFAALEDALPPGVRLEGVSPTHTDGSMVVKLMAVGRSLDDALALPKALHAQGQFEGAFLDSYSERSDGIAIQCSVHYLGKRPTPATPPAAPAATPPAAKDEAR